MFRFFPELTLLLSMTCSVTFLAQHVNAQDVDERPRDPSNMGSTYVPLDSWVYLAFDRLTALGYVQTGFAGQRPWTRMECARLLSEAADLVIDTDSTAPEASLLYNELSREFSSELKSRDGASNSGLQIESIYARSTSVSGPPLTDGYHFAQTLTNDFGRPYGRGPNWYSGLAVRASAGPFAFYVRAEYQRSGRVPDPPADARAAIARTEDVPESASGPISGVSRARLLDAYVSFNFHNNQFSFGNQSLWWGPGQGGPLLFSDNAPPITMFRYDRSSPKKLPSVLRVLGPARTQFFVGRLTGQQFVRIPSGPVGKSGVSLSDQPFIHGQKLTVKPSPNLEIGITRTAIFGGPGFPVTVTSFGRSLFSVGNSGTYSDPGDRRAGFDASYRVPKLRNWLVFYTDVFSDDELFPLAYPTHSAWSPGIYLPKIPKLHKLDFRAEGAITPSRGLFPGFYYFNVHYRSGYTNDRQLLGSWIGRQGSGLQLWTTYWFSTRNKVQLTYRNMWVDHDFLKGGALKDVGGHAQFLLSSQLSLDASLQWERWTFPILSRTSRSNVVASLQLAYQPHWRLK
jgi:hypothetical protein